MYTVQASKLTQALQDAFIVEKGLQSEFLILRKSEIHFLLIRQYTQYA